jgi:hypothetical protein
MSTAELHRALAQSAFATGRSAIDAGVTINGRLPALMAAFLNPSAAGCTAWAEAYAEKVEAAWLGAFAGQAAWTAMLLRAGPWPLTPMGLAGEMLGIAEAAAHPARRRVKANAARYRRRRPRSWRVIRPR